MRPVSYQYDAILFRLEQMGLDRGALGRAPVSGDLNRRRLLTISMRLCDKLGISAEPRSLAPLACHPGGQDDFSPLPRQRKNPPSLDRLGPTE
jgi:hypothetical protein